VRGVHCEHAGGPVQEVSDPHIARVGQNHIYRRVPLPIGGLKKTN
jgi:hypothetical protein